MAIVMETELIILLPKVDLWYLRIHLSGTRLAIKMIWCVDYVCVLDGMQEWTIRSEHCESDC